MGGTSWKHIAMLFIALLGLLAVQLAPRLRSSVTSLGATIGAGNPTFQELSGRFTALAEKRGAVFAFDVLKVAPVPPGTDLHLMGHVVGDILYKQQGIDGIEYCTQDFRNACSHSIVIGTLNEFGPGDSTILKIRAACHKAPGGVGAYTMCFHGLGHGVFAYFGYDIPKAVAFCKLLGTEEYGVQEYTQCVGGLTMELIDGGGHDHDRWTVAHEKYLDPNDPLAPCDRTLIPEEAKSFCYMYLTPHLFEAAGAQLNNPDPATFPAAFRMCDAVPESALRLACYGSFGKEFIPLAAARDIRSIDQMDDAEYGRAIEWCMSAPRSDARGACVEQALSSVFWGGENDPQASFRFCALVHDTDIQNGCYRDLARNIASYLSVPQQEQLCAQLPAEYRTDCRRTVLPKDRS